MTREGILEGIRVVLREQLGIDREVDVDTDIIGDLQLDSLNQLTLVVELENHFRICFEPGDEQTITSVADVITLIDGALPK